MRRATTGIAMALLLAAAIGSRSATGGGEGGAGFQSADSAAHDREKEFDELKKSDKYKDAARRLALLNELSQIPVPRARKFLLSTALKSSNPGDERLYAVVALAKIGDAETLEALATGLDRKKDGPLWQAFGEALADATEKTVRDWLVGPGLESPKNPDALIACLAGLSKNPDPALLPKIVAIYTKNAAVPAGVDVAHAAVRLLGRFGTPEARPTLFEAAKHADAIVRLAAADVLLSQKPFDSDVERVARSLLQDESAVVRQTAAAQAGAARLTPLVEPLIGLLGDQRMKTRHVAATALVQISGLNLGHDPAAWAAWWKTKTAGKADDLTFAQYHGFSVFSDRVLFIVDISGSMRWPWREGFGPHRIEVARRELSSVLKQLTKDTMFNVIVFSEKVAPWKKGEVEASPESVAAAIKWVEKATAEPIGDTHAYEALETAFAENPLFDTIYFLTDGNPTHGKYWTSEGLVASVKAWSRYRRTAVNTIGLSLANQDRGMPNLSEDLSAMANFLRTLAQSTSGEFREVLTAKK